MNKITWFGGFAGAVAALIAWFIALPFRPKAPPPSGELFARHPTFRIFESFYSWFHPMIFGMLAAAGIALVYAIVKQSKHPFLRTIGAMALGGALVLGGAVLNDTLSRSLLNERGPWSHSGGIGDYTIHVAVLSLCLCLALVAVMDVRKKLMERLGITVLISIGVSIGILKVVASGLLAVLIAQMISGQKDPDLYMVESYIALANHLSVGLAVGASLGFSEAITRVAWLRLRRGRGEGMTFSLEGGIARIGSGPGCDVELESMPGVAPIHAQIQQHHDDFALYNAAPPYVTTVNGVSVNQCWLQQADIITIGPYEFEFHRKRPTLGRSTANIPGCTLDQRPRSVSAAGATQQRLIDSFGNEHRLPFGRSILGRDPSCTVSMPWESTVSANHAEIIIDASGVTILDLGSRAGTRVNGVAAGVPKPLQDGDTIELGGAKLTYRT